MTVAGSAENTISRVAQSANDLQELNLAFINYVCDLSTESLGFCMKALSSYYSNACFHYSSGTDVLKKLNRRWDLVYLDGGENPQEMLHEYEASNAKYVLCDDFSTKGLLLKKKYPNFRLYK